MTYGITGASGTLGRLVSEYVLERVEPGEVVLITRDPTKLAQFTEQGVDVRAGDFTDPDTLPGSFSGVDRLLLISTDVVGDRVDGHLAAIDAAAAAGVRWIGYTSILDPSSSNPGAVADEHRATEEHIRAAGIDWTFLRNSIYAEMMVQPAAGALASGTLMTNAGHGATSYVARADCAAVAAAVLTGEGHDSMAYDVTGPAALTAEDQAALFADVGGRPVSVTYLDDESWVAAMVEHAGLPEAGARLFATFGTAARLGYADSLSSVVGDLAGREPTGAREVLEAHRDELG